ncbi:hypothetical protein M4I32_09335 [Microbacterium sp. LRZ72]|uniref:hypothetical protein n=1 Tax=Microbacterium sp. LRZ72 TaxID=2942481 RepID=UPI0029B4E143|nr:hypothetical protein [Microbacterium sp. LRZ72]MDX2376999.1 hypothetical protein [Microbacterium sp. LRZ72]
MSVRTVLGVLALAFALYQGARGILWTRTMPAVPWLLVGAIVFFVVVVAVCIFAIPRAGLRDPAKREPMPVWAAVLAVLATLLLPSATGVAMFGGQDPTATYSTWYIGGLGALMVVVMVRRRPWSAWIGTALLTGGAMVWYGPLSALGQGLVGSIVWVGVAHLLVFLIDRAERDAEQLAELQAVTSSWEAAQEGRERERRVQLQRALAVGGPVLKRVIAMHGVLTDDERHEAAMAEARLRDELRGPGLLDDAVRDAIDAARRRGAQVSVFDEGGLEGVGDEELKTIRAQLADVLRDAESHRIIIRTSPDDRIAVTVVGRLVLDETDEDGVDLWVEIPHPGR